MLVSITACWCPVSPVVENVVHFAPKIVSDPLFIFLKLNCDCKHSVFMVVLARVGYGVNVKTGLMKS